MADIKFDAGFESSTVQGSATLIYKDEDAYKKGTEIPFTQNFVGFFLTISKVEAPILPDAPRITNCSIMKCSKMGSNE